MKIDTKYIIHKLIRLNRIYSEEKENILYWKLKSGKTFLVDTTKAKSIMYNGTTKEIIDFSPEKISELLEYANKYNSTYWISILSRINKN